MSKKLYDSTLPKLYETIVVRPVNEHDLHELVIDSFLEGNSTDRLNHAKHVRFSAPFHENLEERCVHMEWFDQEWDDVQIAEHEARQEEVEKRFPALASQCRGP